MERKEEEKESEKKENIDEPNDADGKMKSMHYLSYSVPKKDFEHKIKRLYFNTLIYNVLTK